MDPFQIFQQKNPTNSITPNTVSGVRLTGDSKLALGVNVSAKRCLSLCVSPSTGKMYRVYPTLWNGSSPTVTLN